MPHRLRQAPQPSSGKVDSDAGAQLTAVTVTAFLTAEQRRSLKELNEVDVPPELFSTALDAAYAMRKKDFQVRDRRAIHMTKALHKRGVDLTGSGNLVPAILFRVEAFARTLELMSLQEVKRLGKDGVAATWRLMVAGATEPIISLVEEGGCSPAFDLDSFRVALAPKPPSALSSQAT